MKTKKFEVKIKYDDTYDFDENTISKCLEDLNVFTIHVKEM